MVTVPSKCSLLKCSNFAVNTMSQASRKVKPPPPSIRGGQNGDAGEVEDKLWKKICLEWDILLHLQFFPPGIKQPLSWGGAALKACVWALWLQCITSMAGPPPPLHHAVFSLPSCRSNARCAAGCWSPGNDMNPTVLLVFSSKLSFPETAGLPWGGISGTDTQGEAVCSLLCKRGTDDELPAPDQAFEPWLVLDTPLLHKADRVWGLVLVLSFSLL